MSLHSKALVISMSIGMPPQSKTLKAESEELEIKHRAEPSQVTAVAKLFAKQDLRGLQKVASAARRWFKDHTLPYGRSQGIIPAKTFFSFTQEIGNFRLDFEQQKRALLDNIETVLQNAQLANGTLFDRGNYPSLQELEKDIYFSIECNPVPSSNDYDKLADLMPEELEVLKNEAVLSSQNKMQSAIQDLFNRLLKTLLHAANKLRDDDEGMQIFRDTLVDNINRAVEAAEILNITDDDQLREFSSKVKELFDGVSASDLRRDPQLRKETADKASELAKRITELF